MVIGGFLMGVAWDAFLTFFCPVLASCSARDLLLSHWLDICVAYHPLRLRLYVYISSSAAGSHQTQQSVFYRCAPVSA